MPSFGAFGTPTFFGGSVGRSDVSVVTLSDDEIAALGERAAVPAAGTLPSDRTPYYAGFQSNGVVWFDGFAALYGLSQHADSANFSMSFWYNPYEETTDILKGGSSQPHASVFCNSVGTIITADGHDDVPAYWAINYTSNPPDNSTDLVYLHTWKGTHHGDPDPRGAPSSVSSSTGGLTIDGYPVSQIGDMQGWSHVMVGVRASGGKSRLTIYVNDTAIVSDQILSNNAFWGNADPVTDDAWTIPFSVPTFTDAAGDYGTPGAMSAPWVVGGTFDATAPPQPDTLPQLDREGQALQGAIMEMWIAPGQYIDWSSSGNRQKFHDVDLTGTHWAPVDLGPKGATPTGTKPQYYFTGGPDKFPINRATGSHARVWHRAVSTTLEGTVDRLTAYNVLPF